ncbi:uncharacterized protein LOC121857149 [Homarus americanus]|uniref:Putative ATPase family AAA domain-containing protein n=1 Tax=Homarus americanus TaxID=6706 RepID=A0A8J5JAG6_HOMAM|nr:uncharacterized protein LOC121857149 [Homarus americanus]KAG7153809.1 putative ATPase family AAA domain-containing protein [Homarus americanus]
MASVIKMINSFKSNHLHGGKRSPAHTSKDTTLREDLPEGCPNSDLVNRRRVSISKSGRYRENHKRRSALPDDTRSSDSDTPASPTEPVDTQNVLLRDKDKKNKENEKNKMNATRRESDISLTDGHAVADEIESLAKTIENGTKADLALT